MNRPRPAPPAPIAPRKIRVAFTTRILFTALGIAAAGVRVLTLPRRIIATRKLLPEKRPVFFYEPYGMGDVIALQPLVRQWLDAGRPVIVATKPQWAAIFKTHPNLTHIGVTPEYASQTETRRKTAFIKDVAAIRNALDARGIHLAGAEAIDVRGDVRSIFAMYLLGCGTVWTLPRYHTANDCRVFPLAARRKPLLDGSSRRIVNSVFAPENAPPLPFPDLSHLLPRNGIAPDPRRIGLIPFASWSGKFWSPERWRELIALLHAEGLNPIALSGPGESAIELPSIPAFQAKDLNDWAALIEKCGAIIAVNTGPMHIADALDKPLVVLEGSSRLPLWGPENPKSTTLSHQDALPCAPCHQTGSSDECAARCMTLITAQEAMSALRRVRNI